MSFDMAAWLAAPITARGFLGEQVTMPRGQRICWLAAANGGFEVKGWGCIRSGPYEHQQGLEQNDAIDLLQIKAFLDGLAAAGVDWSAHLLPMFQAYRDRVKAAA
jgi:hypothetical protein